MECHRTTDTFLMLRTLYRRAMYSIAIFGGTFDPVHLGHIQTSINIQNHARFDRYFFLPCKVPVLKAQALASTQQRIDMLELAIKDIPYFQIDVREINRESPSYMVDTLKSIKKEYPNTSITLILGYDSFISLPQWHQWEQLIHLAHLFVINRDAFVSLDIPKSIQHLIQLHKSSDFSQLKNHECGLIYEFDAGNYNLSSSALRLELKNRKNSEGTALNTANKLPKGVYEYIVSSGLYC